MGGKKHICSKCRSRKAKPSTSFAPEPEPGPEHVENNVESPEAIEAEVEYPIQSSEAIGSGISESKDLLEGPYEDDNSSGFVLDTPQSEATVRSAQHDDVACMRVNYSHVCLVLPVSGSLVD
ncbi:unnamed protein product [Penicillium camemberti]|uniref:Str. FM013 n=1 Tax=Penicillium camemberti (strain FM 013) TaxID=1429867 RepID=A0A0G4PUS2_PENC3|nr:unnamed protein product [Penicillium camemberti]